MPEKHVFLSEEWFRAVAIVVDEHGKAVAQLVEATVNLVVTDTPFGGDVEFHVSSVGGDARTGTGHLEVADAMLRTDYETAAKVFTTGPQAAMDAMLQGRVVIQGDFAKLITALSGAGSVDAGPLQTEIEALTEVPD